MQVRRTAGFAVWLKGLRDQKAKARINVRLGRIAGGNLGDHRSVGEGVHELRFDFGPGYRVYFVRRGDAVIILLAGGSKATQSRDIVRAKQMAKEL